MSQPHDIESPKWPALECERQFTPAWLDAVTVKAEQAHELHQSEQARAANQARYSHQQADIRRLHAEAELAQLQRHLDSMRWLVVSALVAGLAAGFTLGVVASVGGWI